MSWICSEFGCARSDDWARRAVVEEWPDRKEVVKEEHERRDGVPYLVIERQNPDGSSCTIWKRADEIRCCFRDIYRFASKAIDWLNQKQYPAT